MEWIDTSKSILENIYFLSGVILIITLVIGIIQISMAKKTIKINSNRAAASLAANQIQNYCTKIIELQNRLFFEETKTKVPIIKINVGEFNQSYLKEKLGEPTYFNNIKKRIPVALYVLDVLNAMESFAIYFTKGVADEEIAYSSIGRTYCNTVEKLYFDIASCLEDENNKYFSNIRELYKLWSNRLKGEKLSNEKEQLLKELDKLKVEKIKPIGTE
jgi:hypothetical protein